MATANMTIGTKGSDVYSSTGSALLDLSVLLVRGADASTIRDLMNKVLRNASMQEEDDAFVLAFQTRDVRGGKGERDLFTVMFNHLLNIRPFLALKLVDLIPEYGSWRDVMVIFRDVISFDAAVRYLYAEQIRSALFHLIKTQLEKDEADMADRKPSISLLAKWMPREGSEDDVLAKWLARALYPDAKMVSQCLKAYRKRIAPLNRYLETTEIKMCAKEFALINPSSVPGRCLAKNTKAFLNEKLTPGHGLRRPDDPDRMKCREHFMEFFAKAAEGKVKINGATTRYPHEIIKKIATSIPKAHCYCETYDCVGCEEADMSTSERQSLIAVWNEMVKKAKESGGLGKTIAMCDFSGSMQSSSSNRDTPYWVSMAMGLLISELTSDEFKDTFLTFDSYPQWHKLPQGDIFKRFQSISHSLGQGLSTDFQKALDMVLATLKANRVRPGEEPKDLIVITDMNFDAACGSHATSVYTGNRYRHVVKTDTWQTHIQMAREAFKRAGEDMWGVPWTPPRIVIWNVAATSKDFHAQKDEEGVIHLSGWSPSLFKVLTEEGAKVQTPMDALRIMLDADRYQPIRDRLAPSLRPSTPSAPPRKTLRDLLESVRDELRLEDA
jgi:hypothetical protein